MSEFRLAVRYAKSLIDLAREKNQLEEINNDMRLFSQVLKSSRDFLLMLRNPIINPDKKNKVIESVFQGKFSPITSEFFKLVVKKGREAYLPEVAETFISLYNKLKKILIVHLTTAVPINDELVKRFRRLVEEKTGFTNIELVTKINPDIIGGYILQYEDKLYDASVHRNLEVLDDNFLSNIYVKQV
jgi:F-type H+-transporting ATPase subunit delta